MRIRSSYSPLTVLAGAALTLITIATPDESLGQSFHNLEPMFGQGEAATVPATPSGAQDISAGTQSVANIVAIRGHTKNDAINIRQSNSGHQLAASLSDSITSSIETADSTLDTRLQTALALGNAAAIAGSANGSESSQINVRQQNSGTQSAMNRAVGPESNAAQSGGGSRIVTHSQNATAAGNIAVLNNAGGSISVTQTNTGSQSASAYASGF